MSLGCMRKVAFLGMICLIGLCNLTIGNAKAEVMEYDLAYLVHNPETEVIVGDKIFSDWGVPFTPVKVKEGSISVIPLDDEPLNHGLRFVSKGVLKVFPDELLAVGLTYTVAMSSESNRLIKDNSLTLGEIAVTLSDENNDLAPLNANGNNDLLVPAKIKIQEFVNDGPIIGDPDIIGKKTVQVNTLKPESDVLTDSLEFTPIEKLWIGTLISLDTSFATLPPGIDSNFNESGVPSVELLSYEQRFSQTPIPSTVLLFASGLFGLAGLRRKFKK